MIAILLASIGTLFQEVSNSIGKKKILSHQESPYTMAFLNLFWVTIIFLIISLVKRDAFVFSLDSLPTFTARAILEIFQFYVSIFAVVRADRSTYSFIRALTIPLLLIVDIILGYKIGISPLIGMGIIAISLFIIFLDDGIKKKGAGFAILSAVNAVATISLFKYNISNFNSVVAEQLLTHLILLVSFFVLSRVKGKENPIIFLKKPIFFLQSISIGLGGAILSFAYNFGIASVVATAKRASAIFWSILSGKKYFKEKHFLSKMLIFGLLVAGLVFLAL